MPAVHARCPGALSSPPGCARRLESRRLVNALNGGTGSWQPSASGCSVVTATGPQENVRPRHSVAHSCTLWLRRQVGDQLDRGDNEIEILYFLERLAEEAKVRLGF